MTVRTAALGGGCVAYPASAGLGSGVSAVLVSWALWQRFLLGMKKGPSFHAEARKTG